MGPRSPHGIEDLESVEVALEADLPMPRLRGSGGLRLRVVEFVVRERPAVQVFTAMIALSLGISWAVCVVMALLLHGELRWDYLVTAPVVVGLLLLVIDHLRDVKAQLRLAATTDPLTGVYNRRAMDTFLVHETARATRYDRPLSLLLFDVDRFKAFNDTLGHSGGDQALVATVGAISGVLRSADHLFRIGGDEFAVLLPETPQQGALEIAERILQLQPDVEGWSGPRLTLSCGVAQHVFGADGFRLVQAADRAMYRAKRAGGGRVEAAVEGDRSDHSGGRSLRAGSASGGPDR